MMHADDFLIDVSPLWASGVRAVRRAGRGRRPAT